MNNQDYNVHKIFLPTIKCMNSAWVRNIPEVLTVQVVVEYLRLGEVLEAVVLRPQAEDRFCWRFISDGVYSASSAYKAMFVGSSTLRGAKELWKTSAPPKVKFFFWLAIHNGCWTASRRKKRGLPDCDLCALCHQEPETNGSFACWMRLYVRGVGKAACCTGLPTAGAGGTDGSR